MPDIQELINRGRLLFSSAPGRLEIFKLINGKSTAKDIAQKTKRPLTSIIHDIEKIENFNLVEKRTDKDGKLIKKNKSCIYEKTALAKNIPISYFVGVTKTYKSGGINPKTDRRGAIFQKISVPSEQEIIQIANNGEDQIYEFKGPGVETPKITKEIAAFLHTKKGGILFYGIDDAGKIVGSDITRQVFDQKTHNSIRYTIDPQPNIDIKSVNVLGYKVILIIIPPWDKKSLYQFQDKLYIRRGTNAFPLKSSELKLLSKGEYVV